MSNIYGAYTLRTNLLSDITEHLRYWNNWNDNPEGSRVISDKIQIGSFIEHFNDNFPAGAPVLENDSCIAVIDAVIFNREDLFSSLHLTEQPISDEGLLLQYIQCNGIEALASVNGDFSGVIYEKNTGKWIAFRDHLGIRPLFYYVDDNVFLFSTDSRGIASISSLNIRADEEHFYTYAMGYDQNSNHNTEFEDVLCVPPASWVEITTCATPVSLKCSVHSYWELGKNKIRLNSKEEYQKKLYELVKDAVGRRVRAVSGTIGGELSGGLDSSVVSGMIAQFTDDSLFFSWSTSPELLPLLDGPDERRIVLECAEHNHQQVYFSSPQTKANCRSFEQSMEHRWPPDINTLNILEGSLVLKSKGARVMFTGHGGDEGISHRPHPQELWYQHEYWNFFLYYYRQKKGRSLRLLRTIKSMFHHVFKEYPKALDIYHRKPNLEEFLQPDFLERMKKDVQPRPLYFSLDPVKFIYHGGSRSRLYNIAFQGTAAGIRYMVPFLDYRVIDYAVSIPRHLYLDGIKDRSIYRDTFHDVMPPLQREVSYKDFPSLKSQKPTTPEQLLNFKNYRRDQIQYIANHLDDDIWGSILQLDKLRTIDFSDSFPAAEADLAAEISMVLTKFFMAQDILLYDKGEHNV